MWSVLSSVMVQVVDADGEFDMEEYEAELDAIVAEVIPNDFEA